MTFSVDACSLMEAAQPGDITPLTLAVLEGQQDLVLNLIHRHVDLNSPSYVYDDIRRVWRTETPLVTAARLGHLNIVKSLLHGGAYVDTPDTTLGKSPLHWACNRNHTAVAQVLIHEGASVNQRDYTNETALVEAIACRNQTLVQDLLNHGLHLNVHLNYDRDTGLLFALCLGELDTAKSFIQAGADVNRMNIEGCDALSMVLDLTSPVSVVSQLCQLLIAADCNINPQHLSKVDLMYAKCDSYMDVHHLLHSAVRKPRNLASVCRDNVRRILVDKMTGTSILTCLTKLPLPTRLRDFLKLQYL